MIKTEAIKKGKFFHVYYRANNNVSFEFVKSFPTLPEAKKFKGYIPLPAEMKILQSKTFAPKLTLINSR